MSDEYRIIVDQVCPDNIFQDISREITIDNTFAVISLTQDCICCVYPENIDNLDLLKWSGNFLISKEVSDFYLMINTGNNDQIKTKIIGYFKNINIIIAIEDLE